MSKLKDKSRETSQTEMKRGKRRGGGKTRILKNSGAIAKCVIHV